jgi:hypothetical protein
MADDNVVKFSVEGLGSFEAYKEPPYKAILFQRRRALAEKLGGMIELIKIENDLRIYKDSTNENERRYADSLALELFALEGYIDLKTLICKTPEKFELDTLSEPDYGKLLLAFQKARGFFRETGGGEGATPSPTTEPE